MVWDVDFKFKTDQAHYVTGETVAGSVEVVVPENFQLGSGNPKLRFRCVNETKWPEKKSRSSSENVGYGNSETYEYLNVELPIKEKEIITKEVPDAPDGTKKLEIPFSYIIPKDPKLPSSMVTNYGTVQYFFELILKLGSDEKIFTKEITVRAPSDTHLMIAVMGTTSKFVILHGGSVTMTGSIPRKGYAPGQSIQVTLDVTNNSSARLTPRLSLNQTQVYKHGNSHRSVETSFNDEPIVGAIVEPVSEVEEMIQIKVPDDQSLTITSAESISVEYYIHITLEIPHAFNLHLNLPLVITSKEMLESLQAKEQSNETKLLQNK